MNSKVLISLISSAIFLVSSVSEKTSTFKYLYQIKGNSFATRDCIDIYYYKEKLIDKYEDIAFTLKEEYLDEVFRTNISLFKFDDKCFPSYKNGIILLTIGEGKGSLIEGKLRYNACDSEVIREKIYIFDIFK